MTPTLKNTQCVKEYMYICITADIERFSDAVVKYGVSAKADDTLSTRKLLDLFCEVDIPSTLFILGKFADQEPMILDMVRENGHELASHGYNHIDLRKIPPSSVEQEISKSKSIISTKGFRAPYYGFNKKMISLVESHFMYDSSHIPLRTAKEVSPKRIRMLTESLMEIPLSTLIGFPLTSTNMRILPLHTVKWIARHILTRTGYLILNIHPWELTKVSHNAVPFYVKKNTSPGFFYKFSQLLEFLREYDAEFTTMEHIYEQYRS
jgi:peptidoglycan/xylan/chitin deacetylase (PgdA/CDA1 family)